MSNDILKVQRVDGTTLYDSFELSFNPVNILQAINNNAVAVNVYSKSAIDTGLNLKAANYDDYTTTDINVALTLLHYGIDKRVSMNIVDSDVKFKINATSNDIEHSKSWWECVMWCIRVIVYYG